MSNTAKLKVTTTVLKTPMGQGVAAGYDRLAERLASPGDRMEKGVRES